MCWTVPLDSRLCEYYSVLCYILVIFLKPCAFVKKGTWYRFSGWGLTSLSYKADAVHNHLNLDLNSKTIWCYYYKNGTRCQSKENWANFDVKWAITCVFPELYLSFCLLELDGKEVLTSAFITSLNSSSSLSRIVSYFLNSSPWYLLFSSSNTWCRLVKLCKMVSC